MWDGAGTLDHQRITTNSTNGENVARNPIRTWSVNIKQNNSLHMDKMWDNTLEICSLYVSVSWIKH